jgi:hypothetical protein
VGAQGAEGAEMKHKLLVNLTLCGVIEVDSDFESADDVLGGQEFVFTQNSSPGLLLGALLSQMKKRNKDDFANWSEQPFAVFKIAPATDEQIEQLGVIQDYCGTDVAVSDAFDECENADCPWCSLGTAF